MEPGEQRGVGALARSLVGSDHVMITMWTIDEGCFGDGAAHICLRMGMSLVESNVLIDTRVS